VENIDGEPKKSIIIVSDYKTVDGNLWRFADSCQLLSMQMKAGHVAIYLFFVEHFVVLLYTASVKL
jgi:hypothetical protein